MRLRRSVPEMPRPEDALPGRDAPAFEISGVHAVNGRTIVAPFPDGIEVVIVAMGCFWGAERLFWQVPGVYSTAVGYTAGYTPNPTYEETCTGLTGHTEAVLVAYDPTEVEFRRLLEVFFTEHDPTQGPRQGNDIGTQYRSGLYWTTDDQADEVEQAVQVYAVALAEAGKGNITTELSPARAFYYAEEYHQQYLHKVPNGYCGLQGTGVSCTLAPPPDEDLEAQALAAGPAPEDADGAATGLVGGEGAGDAGDPGLKPLADSDEEWRGRLSPEQYAVLREAGTERAFTGAYTDIEDPGLYRCAACGNPLYTSDTKFHSGSGWPSFTEAVSPDAVETREDRSHGMVRVEARCGRCRSHLGHVFPDGPPDRGGMRHCLNSVALDLEAR
jgi:peptide-methionine (S)-S-oxide reductase